MNRKPLGGLLLVLGIVLIVAALVLRFAIVPGLKQFPGDVDTTRIYTGTMPEEDRNNMSLYASCVSGAEEKADYLTIVQEVGFRGVSVVSQKPYAVEGDRPYGLESITVSGVK